MRIKFWFKSPRDEVLVKDAEWPVIPCRDDIITVDTTEVTNDFIYSVDKIEHNLVDGLVHIYLKRSKFNVED